MRKLSTGLDATLGNYREMSVVFFGARSGAVEFLDNKIAEEGEDTEVLADEGQMLILLMSMTGQAHTHDLPS